MDVRLRPTRSHHIGQPHALDVGRRVRPDSEDGGRGVCARSYSHKGKTRHGRPAPVREVTCLQAGGDQRTRIADVTESGTRRSRVRRPVFSELSVIPLCYAVGARTPAVLRFPARVFEHCLRGHFLSSGASWRYQPDKTPQFMMGRARTFLRYAAD